MALGFGMTSINNEFTIINMRSDKIEKEVNEVNLGENTAADNTKNIDVSGDIYVFNDACRHQQK